MAYYNNYEDERRQKAWLVNFLLELTGRQNDTVLTQFLWDVEVGTLAEMFFKRKYNLLSSLTGDYEDFADGDDSKTGTDQDYQETHNMFPTSYRVFFKHCGNKHGAIRGLAFNRRANRIDEFYIPKGCFPANISLSYRKESNELFGKYKDYLVTSYLWD